MKNHILDRLLEAIRLKDNFALKKAKQGTFNFC